MLLYKTPQITVGNENVDDESEKKKKKIKYFDITYTYTKNTDILQDRV